MNEIVYSIQENSREKRRPSLSLTFLFEDWTTFERKALTLEKIPVEENLM